MPEWQRRLVIDRHAAPSINRQVLAAISIRRQDLTE